MAIVYSTGTGANVSDFLAALKTFAEANFWSIIKFDAPNKLLFMEKGNCHITLGGRTDITEYDGELNANRAAHQVRGSINTSINSASTSYLGHPGGSTSDSGGNPWYGGCCDMTGPFVGWHFFTSDVAPYYIHATIQTASDRFTHLIFGNMDTKGMAHGGAYFSGHIDRSFRDIAPGATGNPLDTSNWNKPALRCYPFYKNSMNMIYTPDGFPTAWNWTTVRSEQLFLCDIWNNPYDRPNNLTRGRLMDNMQVSEPASWSGRAMLWNIPLIGVNNAEQQFCYIGEVPNLRYMRMDGLAPGAEFTLGSDTWKVFPVRRQTGVREWGNAFQWLTSGPYGIAHKKVKGA